MDLLHQELLTGDLVPVLLGTSIETIETAKRLHRKYGVVSHVFCERTPLLLRLSVAMRLHPVSPSRTDRLLLEALQDFAAPLAGSDAILYLIPCTAHHASFLKRHRDLLERQFILSEMPQARSAKAEASACEKGGAL